MKQPSPRRPTLPANGTSMTLAGLALVSQLDGSIDGTTTGLFWKDHRLIAGLNLSVAVGWSQTTPGLRAETLHRTRIGPGTDRLTYGLWLDRSEPEALLTRTRSLVGGYRETIEVTSLDSRFEATITVAITPGGAPVFRLFDPEPTPEAADLVAEYLVGGDFLVDREDGHFWLGANVALEPGKPSRLEWRLDLDPAEPISDTPPHITASDSRLELACRVGGWDLTALTNVDPASGNAFVAAGAPHFLALFGRDALIANLLSMIAGTDRAIETLEALAHHQGVAVDQASCEEPGRIPHELRIGMMGVFDLAPGEPYYATIDASPLFVVLMGEYLRWAGPSDRLKRLIPTARRAIDWCRSHVDRHGFIVSTPHRKGLKNQGWKDSLGAMVDDTGSIHAGASSPVEVQGYYHEALLALAELEANLGDHRNATGLRAEADELATKIVAHFGSATDADNHEATAGGAEVPLAMALDDHGSPLRVSSSNAGHVLASSALPDRLARSLADRLVSTTDFSGWGVRTLAADEAGFNPLGYHIGSVWPHDNGMILRGLARRGYDGHTRQVAEAMVALAQAHEGQLPELVGGFDRDSVPVPVPYLASARPQAWAAAVPFQVVTALIGLVPDLVNGRLDLRPILAPDETITIEGLRLGPDTITIHAQGTTATVIGADHLQVTVHPSPAQ